VPVGRLAAVALTQPLAWELPYAMGITLKKKRKKKKIQEGIINRSHMPKKV